MPLLSKNLTTALFYSYYKELPATATIVPVGFHFTLLKTIDVSTAIGSSSLSFFIKISLPCWYATHNPIGASYEYIVAFSYQSIPAKGIWGLIKFSGSTTLWRPVILIWCKSYPFSSKTVTWPSKFPIKSYLEFGAQQTIAILNWYYLPHLLFPSTPPTITWPS